MNLITDDLMILMPKYVIPEIIPQNKKAPSISNPNHVLVAELISFHESFLKS